jgi:hypothetical protein
MSKDSELAISLVRAIEHGHIPLEEESQCVLETVLLSTDAAGRKNQRETLNLVSKEIDKALEDIDVYLIPETLFDFVRKRSTK